MIKIGLYIYVVLFSILYDGVYSQLPCYGGSILSTVVLGSVSNSDNAVSAMLDNQDRIIVGGISYNYTDFTTIQSKTNWTNSNLALSDIWVTYTYLNQTTNQTVFFYGGENQEYLYGMGIDNTTKNLCMVGSTASNGFPRLNSILSKPYNNTILDMFVTVVNSTTTTPDQQKKLSDIFGGLGSDYANAVSCDSGLAYVVGSTTSSNFTSNSTDLGNTNSNLFIAIVNITSGKLLYSTVSQNNNWGALAGTFYKNGSSKFLALTGQVQSSIAPIGNAYQPNYGGSADAFLYIVDVTNTSNVTATYFSYFGGTGVENGRAITVDEANYVYIVGFTGSDDLFDCDYTLADKDNFYPEDVFLAVFNPNGSLSYCSYIGGNYTDEAKSVSVISLTDGGHLVYIGGITQSPDFPTIAGFKTPPTDQNEDAFVTVIRLSADYSTGTRVFSSCLGTAYNDEIWSIQALPSGRFIISGQTSGSNFLTSNRTVTYSDWDAFYAVLDCPALLVASPSPTPSRTPSVSPSGTPVPSHKSHAATPLGLIVGVAVGGAAGIMIAVAVVAFFVIRKRRKPQDDMDMQNADNLNLYGNNPSYNSVQSTMPRESQDVINAKANELLNQKWEIPYTDLTIKSELGSGAFGIVYKAQWRNSDCVVKQINILNANEKMRNDFLTEIDTVKNLRNHPNVCGMLGLCIDPEYPICLVMEFVEGGNLQDLVYEHKVKLTKQIILQFASDICAGMSHLHHENILHCDLAARNLLWTKLGSKYLVKITDFGLAAITRDEYDGSHRKHVPIRWSAPEVLLHLKMSRASDVWSFGVVMWEILEGKMPYPGMDNTQVKNYVCVQKKVLQKPTESEYPAEIYEIMLKCWKFDPSERPSFDELFKSFGMLMDDDQRKDMAPKSPSEGAPTTYQRGVYHNNANTTYQGRTNYEPNQYANK